MNRRVKMNNDDECTQCSFRLSVFFYSLQIVSIVGQSYAEMSISIVWCVCIFVQWKLLKKRKGEKTKNTNETHTAH